MKERKRVTKRSRKAKTRSISLRASAEEGAFGRSPSTAGAGSEPTSRRGRRGAAGDTTPSREWILKYRAYYRPRKMPVTLRLDADVLAWFKKQGRGYQTRINRELRALMMKEKKKAD